MSLLHEALPAPDKVAMSFFLLIVSPFQFKIITSPFKTPPINTQLQQIVLQWKFPSPLKLVSPVEHKNAQ